MHWDVCTKSWKRDGAERGAAQDDVENSEVTGVNNESRTNDAGSRTVPCHDSGTVLAALQGVSASSADAQTSSSSLSPNARVVAEVAHDDGIAQQGATTASDIYLVVFAPEEQDDDSSTDTGRQNKSDAIGQRRVVRTTSPPRLARTAFHRAHRSHQIRQAHHLLISAGSRYRSPSQRMASFELSDCHHSRPPFSPLAKLVSN